ncbi:hypothetical protein CPLU01_07041 [Colletotrichum plurivorum]|uniref:Uncharacterized protein n=1 Tax=Colletotrichum plurivorum TaxID=2175906 RepID=A0A8H6NFJ5_9PEZI|nr:hypothetical protein CPLU01_07041 [Colletotrichum plurivorum]
MNPPRQRVYLCAATAIADLGSGRDYTVGLVAEGTEADVGLRLCSRGRVKDCAAYYATDMVEGSRYLTQSRGVDRAAALWVAPKVLSAPYGGKLPTNFRCSSVTQLKSTNARDYEDDTQHHNATQHSAAA